MEVSSSYFFDFLNLNQSCEIKILKLKKSCHEYVAKLYGMLIENPNANETLSFLKRSREKRLKIDLN